MEPQSFVGLDTGLAEQLMIFAVVAAGVLLLALLVLGVSIFVTLRIVKHARNLSSTEHLPSAHWIVATLCIFFLMSCGPTRYLPIQILTPPIDPVNGVDSSSAVAVGSVKLWVCPGPEWLEVAVLNAGSNPVAIDWIHATFIEPSGKIHSLISGSELGEVYSRIQVMYVAQRDRANGNTEMFSAGQRMLVTDRLLDEVQTNRESLTLVAPGSKREELFYPKDHVRLDWEGGWRATSLFCDRAMVAEWLYGESFELFIPLLIDDRWTNVRIVGRIER